MDTVNAVPYIDVDSYRTFRFYRKVACHQILRKTRNMKTRAEHLQECKDRAIEYVDRGDLQNAYASMASDLTKHPDTEKHAAIGLGMQLMMIGDLDTPEKMRRFIEGFN